MNPFIFAQLVNMQCTVENCKSAAHGAARKDDGVIDVQERALLRAMDKACDKFIQQLQFLQKHYT